MMNTVSMTIVAMTFGGVLEHTGILRSIVNQILKLAKSAKGLIASTIASCFATNLTCSEQYISIVVLQECTQMPTRKKDYIQKLIQSIRRWWNINFCLRSLEYVRCIYSRNTWRRCI